MTSIHLAWLDWEPNPWFPTCEVCTWLIRPPRPVTLHIIHAGQSYPWHPRCSPHTFPVLIWHQRFQGRKTPTTNQPTNQPTHRYTVLYHIPCRHTLLYHIPYRHHIPYISVCTSDTNLSNNRFYYISSDSLLSGINFLKLHSLMKHTIFKELSRIDSIIDTDALIKHMWLYRREDWGRLMGTIIAEAYGVRVLACLLKWIWHVPQKVAI